MGRPKLSLPFGPETMLQRVIRLLGEVVSPIVVVAAPQQELPDLPDDVLVARDEQEGLGPLAGLAAGLTALGDRAEAAYASSCDVPLLKPAFVRRIVESLGEHDMAVVREDRHFHPLAAVYRTRLAETARRLIAEDRLRPFFLVENSNARIIEAEQLGDVDPRLDSLRNTNTPEEYESALRDAGLK